ncbi:hypothetical protein QEN58_13740 [Halomonas alkaliantarctica]|uniref:Uncharacterized protein n=1 Tax=Halomonas alkaliantarctica TaxID=232346 RepID=A0ABY8LIV0_9GAMM|nr:hypothetical protein [Halomonas alkaliantarctica]WGI24386.1 hypothetical protein QEN58_13740 [Halomonas alkaliantarctica]
MAGLAAGWEIQPHLRRQQAVDEPLISKGVQLGWSSGDMESDDRDSQPLFQRDTAHGVEYYVHTPNNETRGTGRRRTRTRHGWAVRVQWEQAQAPRGVPHLPRVLPAPAPLKDPADIPQSTRLTPDFTEVDRPYWADEMTDKDEVTDG